ncbi:MAG: hypothetical protein ACFFEY_01180 [Candidatus Thorarchaeota archaeon]
MSTVIVIIQILFITLGMIGLGMVLNYFLGLRKDFLKEMRQRALNLRERMKNAQLTGDYQLMARLQRESVQFMKLMMRKQLVPLCLRCFIFIGIFLILGAIYADYNTGLLPFPILIFGSGWLALYIIFSLYFTLFIYGIKKLTGLGGKTQGSMREITALVSPGQAGTGLRTQLSKPLYQTQDESQNKDSWKERIEE